MKLNAKSIGKCLLILILVIIIVYQVKIYRKLNTENLTADDVTQGVQDRAYVYL